METKRLLEQLAGTDEVERQIAQEELGARMDDDVAAAIMQIATGAKDEDVRGDALIALGPVVEECGIDYDEGFADDPLAGDETPPVSRETFKSIVARVRAMYDDDSQPKLVRRRSFEVLIRDPQPWHVAEIRKHFASPDPDWRRTAVFAMGMISGFEREIAGTVVNAQGPLLYEAVRAAGRMEVTAAAAKVRELAESEQTERDLRVVAILALPNLDPKATRLLEKLMQSPDEEVSDAAEEALDELSFRSQVMERLEGDDE